MFRTIKAILTAALLSLAAIALIATPTTSEAKGPKKKVEKCDPKGKPCKKGKECKPENCNKKDEPAEDEDEDEGEGEEQSSGGAIDLPNGTGDRTVLQAGPKKKVEKCDPKGNACKKGKNCKPENCKKKDEPAGDEDEDEGEGEDEGEEQSSGGAFDLLNGTGDNSALQTKPDEDEDPDRDPEEDPDRDPEEEY